jgi:cytochrome bd ubiquinol oxidase subunit I
VSPDTFVELSRLQFAMTTLFHYLFVPLTLGLAPIVAVIDTIAWRTGKEHYERLARFLGSLLLINFAMGIVTGIIQEFQFGMNWSVYSAFVGDIFGAPLAMEGIFAFFLESTFLGLWVFGRNRLPRGLHVATIWIVVLGTWASAYFIITANSWMQNPVGYEIDQSTGRAVLTDPAAVFGQELVWWAWTHALLGGLVAASVFVFAVAAYHLKRRQHLDTMSFAWKFAIVVGIISGTAQAFVGDGLGVVMTEKQPMKIAAAEAVWETTGPCAGLSIVAVPIQSEQRNAFDVEVPCLLSIVATNSLDGTITGMTELQQQYEQEYGPGNYIPNVWVAFYSFRLMMGFGLVGVLWMVLAAWLTRRGRLPTARWFWATSIWIVVTPWLGNMFGWIFTENGRQPWVVYGELKTADASSGLSPGFVIGSILVFGVLYAAFAVVEVKLIKRYAIAGPATDHQEVPLVHDLVETPR